MPTQKKKKKKKAPAKTRETVELTPDAKRCIKEIKKTTDLPGRVIAFRALEWLSKMDADVQGTIVGALPRGLTGAFIREILLKTGKITDRAGNPDPKQEDADHLARDSAGKVPLSDPDTQAS